VHLQISLSHLPQELAEDLFLETESGIQIGGPFDFGDCYNGFETVSLLLTLCLSVYQLIPLLLSVHRQEKFGYGIILKRQWS
jgi:hypothetical protein